MAISRRIIPDMQIERTSANRPPLPQSLQLCRPSLIDNSHE
jgi:hypothetical protein